MQPQGISRKKAIFLLVGALVVFLAIVAVIIALTSGNTNQFGKFIRIQNYGSKVHNLSSDMRDSMEASLYNTVSHNVDKSIDPTHIGDAKIRDNSDVQAYSSQDKVYSGSFIVDMASIKQSYEVQYTYATPDSNTVVGSPVIVSCLSKDKLIYGEFPCQDAISKQSSGNEALLQYLPYDTYSYKISPQETSDGKLIVNVTMTIPESDLKGNAASRANVVTMHKEEVLDWIRSKGLNPADYTIQFNYDDAGNLIQSPDTPDTNTGD